MGLSFFFQFKPSGPLCFSLFPKWLHPVESFGGRTLDLRQLLLALSPSAGNSALQPFLPQRYGSPGAMPAPEFITISPRRSGHRVRGEAGGWNSELFRFFKPFTFSIFAFLKIAALDFWFGGRSQFVSLSHDSPSSRQFSKPLAICSNVTAHPARCPPRSLSWFTPPLRASRTWCRRWLEHLLFPAVF